MFRLCRVAIQIFDYALRIFSFYFLKTTLLIVSFSFFCIKNLLLLFIHVQWAKFCCPWTKNYPRKSERNNQKRCFEEMERKYAKEHNHFYSFVVNQCISTLLLFLSKFNTFSISFIQNIFANLKCRTRCLFFF